MQAGGETDRRNVRRSMHARFDLVHRRIIEYSPQCGDATGMRYGGPYIVDELFGYQRLIIPDRIENLTDRQRRRRMLSNQSERFLILGRSDVFQPEQIVGFEIFSQFRRLNGGHSVVAIVQKRDFFAEFIPDCFENSWNVT